MAKKSKKKNVNPNRPVARATPTPTPIIDERSRSAVSPESSFWPTLLGVWLAVLIVAGTLHWLIAGASTGGRELPLAARLALFCYELAILSAAFFAAVSIANALPRRRPAAESKVRAAEWFITLSPSTLLVGVGVLLYSSNWAKFWHTGKFLSIIDFLFVAPHPVQIFHWIGIDVIVVVLLATVAITLLIIRWLPRSIGRCQPRAQALVVKVAAPLLGVALLGSAVGELYSGLAERRWSRVAFLYADARDYGSGPLAHALSGLRRFASRAGEAIGASIDLSLSRRPIVPMQKYLADIGPLLDPRWNVIVLMVESLGANQLTSYGGKRAVMPALESLARNARVFTNTYAQASHTNYATPVAVSSHYPLRAASVYDYPKNPSYPRVMIYDVLKAMGYRTAMISSSNEYWGGMINYYDTGGLDQIAHAATFKGPTYVAEGDTGFSTWVQTTKHAGSVDDRYTIGEALNWIDGGDSKPFFLYVNLQNSHLPYVIPNDFKRRFSPVDPGFSIRFGKIPKDKVEVAKDIYADSLAYVDLQIDRLFQHLKQRRLWDKTIIVVTGDHGQAFYEHGFSAHAGEIYNEVMKVPLLVRAPENGPGIDERLAQHADIAPTILHLLGLPAHPSFQGSSLLTSESNPAKSVYLVAQTPQAYQIGLVRSRHKLIYDEWRQRYQLFDLVSDPAERVDIANQNQRLTKELAARLQTWRKLQIDYYADKALHTREYPPILKD